MKAKEAYELASKNQINADKLFNIIASSIENAAKKGCFQFQYLFNDDDLIYTHYSSVMDKLKELGYECYFREKGCFEVNWDEHVRHHLYHNNPYMKPYFI